MPHDCPSPPAVYYASTGIKLVDAPRGTIGLLPGVRLRIHNSGAVSNGRALPLSVPRTEFLLRLLALLLPLLPAGIIVWTCYGG